MDKVRPGTGREGSLGCEMSNPLGRASILKMQTVDRVVVITANRKDSRNTPLTPPISRIQAPQQPGNSWLR